MKKYELTSEYIINALGVKLFRIKAVRKFGSVEAGELGGYIEKEENLSQEGNAWVYENAEVCGDAEVYGDAWVCGNAKVYGDAEVCETMEYTVHQGYGRRCRITTFFRMKNDEIGVKCGCFYGTLDEFRKEVEKTHGDSDMGKEYQGLADLAELRSLRWKKERRARSEDS